MKSNLYPTLRGLAVCAAVIFGFAAQAQSPAINITQQLPAVVTAGDNFDVTFTINKGNLQSFARLQQQLPAGFVARMKNGKDYRTYVKGNKTKHVWVSLPNSQEFTVTYNIKVSRKIAGDYTLGGEFNYVANNTKQFAVIEPASIKVLPNVNALASAEDEDEDLVPVGGSTAYDDNIFDK